MHIVIASDHAGVRMKSDLIETLGAAGHTVTDLGANSEESCDYPDYAVAAASRVAGGDADLGVLICGTGIGMSMSANKVRGIRAAAVSDPVSAGLARSHNDANVVCLGARIVGPEVATAIVQTFVSTPFSGGERHSRRVAKINAIENRA
jgi:ribose 5-phosphate isomerase B